MKYMWSCEVKRDREWEQRNYETYEVEVFNQFINTHKLSMREFKLEPSN
jgi:hypothetical protein